MFKGHFLLASIVLLLMVGCGKNSGMKDAKVGTTSQLDLEEGSYSIIKEKSEFKWTGKELTSETHTGILFLKEGIINIDSNGIIDGKVVIDMASIIVTDLQGEWKDKLEGHLKNPDFFDVEKFPTAFITFQSTKKPNKENKINLDGELTIKDITHPLSFTADLIHTAPFLKAQAILSFDRSKYDVRFRSGKFFENLGDKLILDEIDIDIILASQ